MGEEEKKPEEAKKEEPEKKEEAQKPAEEKKDEKKLEESKDGKESKEEPPPPPPEIVLKVFMHCEGCARKVRRSLKGFEGVEDVTTDCKNSKVVVKGEKADPLKVLDRVQRKSHRQVQLISPIPKPPAPGEEKKPKEEEKPNPEEKIPEPEIITVVLKVHMHCDPCAQEIKSRILKMKGVESVEPDLKNSQVSVKGVFEPTKLVEFVYKRTGKHAAIVKQEPEKKEKAEEAKDEKKAEKGDREKKRDGEGEENKEKKGVGEVKAEAEAAKEENTVVEMRMSEFQHYPPPRFMEMYAYPYAPPPQIFSDENPNACSVM